jgi:choline kinase
MEIMSQPKCAVILAAGLGIRLRRVIGELPKGLLEIDGMGLIERTLGKLINHGINDVYIVTGFKHELLEEELTTKVGKNLNLQFIHNNLYDDSGSMESLYQMKTRIRTDFLLFESDLIYENKALDILLNYGSPNTILTSGITKSNDEVWVYGDPIEAPSKEFEQGRIKFINKKINSKFIIQGELVGISWISQSLFTNMCQYHEENKPKTIYYHYEENISDISPDQEIKYLKIPDLIWAEIDDESHYFRVINTVYPRIQEKNIP